MFPLSVLAAVCGAQDDEVALVVAADLARRHGTTAVVVNTFDTGATRLPAPAFGGGAMTSQLVEAIAERKEAVGLQTRALVEQVARGDGAIRLAPSAGPARSTLMRELPLVDLAVLAQSYVSSELGWIDPLGETLLEARVPVYLARDKTPVAGRVAAIAWDGSFEAARAVRAALPLLRDASGIAILQSTHRLDGSEGSRADPARLAAWLGERGLAAPKRVTVGDGKIGPELLKAAADAGAALLVAGAYRHSRISEALFGGVTRAFIEAADGPHLVIAH